MSCLIARIVPFALAASLARRLLLLAGFGAGTSVASSGEIRALRKALAFHAVGKSGIPIFIDAGAHIGEWSHAALAAFPNATIHAFEPSSAHRAQFPKVLLDYAGYTLSDSALGRADGSAMLYKDKETTGLASLTRRELSHHGIEMNLREEVAVAALDTYALVHGIKRIDYLKIDVEGHELDVLMGAADLLRRGAILAVQFEFGGCNIDTRTYFRDFYTFFAQAGFDIYIIRRGGSLARIRRYREFLEQFVTTNFLAIRRRGPADSREPVP